MNFEYINKTKPITFYILSMLSFVAANYVREMIISLYFILLILGFVFTFLGFRNRIKSKNS